MVPKNIRSTAAVVADLQRLDRTAFEVRIPVVLLAELIRAGYSAGPAPVPEGSNMSPHEAHELALNGLAIALSTAVIDGLSEATPYLHNFAPIYSAVYARGRSEHILDNIGTPAVYEYPPSVGA